MTLCSTMLAHSKESLSIQAEYCPSLAALRKPQPQSFHVALSIYNP